MKVLAYIRNDYKSNIGGDSIQFTKTVEYLKRKGIDVVISSNQHEDLRPYDLVHIFNTIRIGDTYRYYKRSKDFKKKIVLSPIYWNYGIYLYKNFNKAKFINRWNMDNVLRKEVMQNVDLILPSSKIELDIIKKDFNTKRPCKIVYNGVDACFSEGKSEKFLDRYEINNENFVLSVGRICPHKNQLTLAKICQSIDIPFVMIGPVNDIEYFNKCKDENPFLIHINGLNHEELVSAYRAAKVHCLVSWYETPGLVNLEAGIAGCNILTTPEGSTKEYFKDYVEYSTWDDDHNILEKIVALLSKNKDYNLKNHIVNNFLWEDIADSIIDAYRTLLN
ncbi:glycosyltransferase family 4 protein [Alkaliphilus sp. MSJ-5]|uniref:Glycosyltransferase family 4 protein n=1 Tax=Alkaliphilus flagellatus TaxID=2841507 RepID=A0ABS6G982_9FIRM|nr:glycosyltransferase family 4 protein [Alkaliphilus flagellatus]MBU5677955.1 glycosyltransferase family 4 protein [Alkaliphilus flagellatus]